jgi:hypothetical protein
MANALTIIIPALILLWVYLYKRSHTKKQEELTRESLEDESIYIEGIGNVKYEDLDTIVEEVPEDPLQKQDANIFSEDLLEFEGQFMIPDVPLNEERRLSIDDAFLYLQELFGKDILRRKIMRTMDDKIFPIQLNDAEDIYRLAQTIARIMDINPEKIVLDYFSENEYHEAAGLYKGKDEDGNYHVALLDSIYTDIEKVIATIAHEFAHIKLLGEERMDENSEELTDMVTLIYGFGIFNSNVVFKLTGDHVERSWTTSSTGYLSQADWGYLFALYQYVSGNSKPHWITYLNKTIAKDAALAYEFMIANPALVLQNTKHQAIKKSNTLLK